MDEKKSPNEIKPEKVLVEWTAMSRPHAKLSREASVKIIVSFSLIGFLLLIIEGIMPVMLLVSLLFLLFVFSSVEPEKVKYEITDQGIKVGGFRTDWQNLGRFWYTARMGSEVMVVEAGNIAGRLEIVLDESKKGEITKIMQKYSILEHVPPSGFDKASNWIAKNLLS